MKTIWIILAIILAFLYAMYMVFRMGSLQSRIEEEALKYDR